jgi:hypothetical protein
LTGARIVQSGKAIPRLFTDQSILRTTETLRNAVISILDKYRFWAEGFMEGAGTNPTEMSNEP